MMESARPVKILITCLGFLALISLVFGFSNAQTSQVTTPDRSLTMFRHVAIMPFLKGRFESPDGQVDKPLSQRLTRIVFDQQSLRASLSLSSASSSVISFRPRSEPPRQMPG